MSNLTFEVQEFIEQNIDLIEEQRWDEVYDNAAFSLDPESTGKFTKAMLDVGLDPINEAGLDYIPDYYLSDQDIEKFNIPSSVSFLSEGCFAYSKLKSITIPESVTEIGDFAFQDCSNLSEIVLNCTTAFIKASAFKYLPDGVTIRCIADSPVADRMFELNDGTWRIKCIG